MDRSTGEGGLRLTTAVGVAAVPTSASVQRCTALQSVPLGPTRRAAIIALPCPAVLSSSPPLCRGHLTAPHSSNPHATHREWSRFVAPSSRGEAQLPLPPTPLDMSTSKPSRREGHPSPSSSSTALTKPVDPSQSFPLTSLIPYLCLHLPNFSHLHSLHPLALSQFTHGQSNPTFLLTVGPPSSPTHFVLRKQPKGPLLPSAHLIDREFRVLSALAPTPVPVPRVYCLCEDASVIGEKFYVMEYVEGRVLKQAELPGMRWEDRFAIYSAMCEVLGALHSVDVRAVGLEGFGVPGGYAQRTVSRWSRQYLASKTDEVDSMEQLMRWLQSHVKEVEESAVSILHGDYRLDNLIFHPTQNRVVAVLVSPQPLLLPIPPK